jgi:Arm DNA-binding domain
MAGQRITKRVIEGLKVMPREYAKWDGQLPGFGVRVRPSGAKSYVVSYRAETKLESERRAFLGRWQKGETPPRSDAGPTMPCETHCGAS